jgi:hypothetical protein
LTYEILSTEPNPLLRLRGIAKEIYEEPDEWEREIERERELFSDIQDKRGLGDGPAAV